MRACHALLLLAACTNDGGSDADGMSCDDVAIAQGLYGRVVYVSDVGDATPMPVANERVEVLDAPRGTAIAETRSNGDGAFEIALDAGVYALCPPPPSECVTLSIATGQRVRGELTKGLPTTWSLDPNACD